MPGAEDDMSGYDRDDTTGYDASGDRDEYDESGKKKGREYSRENMYSARRTEGQLLEASFTPVCKATYVELLPTQVNLMLP